MTHPSSSLGDKAVVDAEIARSGGILRLDPAYVARDWIPEGGRFPIPGGTYDAGERGSFSERWLVSTTHADNRVGPDDEGLSYLRLGDGGRVLLSEAVAAAFESIAGAEYAASHDGLGRLAKIFDYDARVPFHIHPPKAEAAKVNRNPKDEAYYFPPQESMGPHPETFLGLHASFAGGAGAERIVDLLRVWDSDRILGFSRAYQQIEEEGFFVPSGVLHGPGTAITLELQEDSDTLAMLQAVNSGREVPKRLLFKDISEADQAEQGEAAVLSWIDWERNTDPRLYENLHHGPVEIFADAGVSAAWIFQGTRKFSGKRLLLQPGARYTASERGVFSAFAWQGRGTVGGVEVRGGQPGEDELLVVHSRAVEPLEYVNTGADPLLIVTFFGPDINDDSPLVDLR